MSLNKSFHQSLVFKYTELGKNVYQIDISQVEQDLELDSEIKKSGVMIYG
jgi:hypothetical protein